VSIRWQVEKKSISASRWLTFDLSLSSLSCPPFSDRIKVKGSVVEMDGDEMTVSIRDQKEGNRKGAVIISPSLFARSLQTKRDVQGRSGTQIRIHG